jgi:hypothetical protein
MNKFDNLFKHIITEMAQNGFDEEWDSNDEYNVRVLYDPTLDPYDMVFYIQCGDSPIKLLKRADSEEAIWVSRNIIDELKAGMSFDEAFTKWQEILLDQKSKSNW